MNAIWKPSHFVGAYVYKDAIAQYVFGDEGEPVYEPFGGSRRRG